MYTLKILCSNCCHVENDMEVDTKKNTDFLLTIEPTPCSKCGSLLKHASLQPLTLCKVVESVVDHPAKIIPYEGPFLA